jgi:hypothetical protein
MMATLSLIKEYFPCGWCYHRPLHLCLVLSPTTSPVVGVITDHFFPVVGVITDHFFPAIGAINDQ